MPYTFPGPYTPYKHQKTTARFIIAHPRCFVLDEMGLGKSASVLWAYDYLATKAQAKRLLIIAPLSTLTRVWRDECFKLLMHRNVVVLHGTAQKRRTLYADSNWDIGIINYDGVKILAPQIEQDIASGRLNMVVCDEASIYRNSQTKRFKLLRELLAPVERLVLATGTPCPEAPTDAFGLAKMLGNENAPKYFGAWQRATMIQASQFKWVPRPDGYEQAYKILQPAVRHIKADCIDLPPVTTQEHTAELTTEQKVAYKSMTKEMVIEFRDSDDLTAAHAADKINKLRQIACGVIKDTETGEYIVLNHAPRIAVTLEAIEQASAKSIIVVPFKGIIYELERALRRCHTTAVINGDVSATKRNDIIERFRNTPDPKVLLVHPKVMAHGLTLVEADMMVFYAPIYSNEETKQIVERINRPGQTRSMTIVRLGATALEWEIYRRVEQKNIGEQGLLDMYKEAMREQI